MLVVQPRASTEAVMKEASIHLVPIRKENSKRPLPAYVTHFNASIRKIVENTGNRISQLLPKVIHAITAKGFELKVGLFVLACSVNFL
jgi:hypothetical protein